MGRESGYLTKEVHIAIKMKRCSASFVTGEMQNTMYLLGQLKKKTNSGSTSCWQVSGATQTLVHYWWESRMVKSSSCTPRYLSSFLEILCLRARAHTHTHTHNSFIHHCQIPKVRCPSIDKLVNHTVEEYSSKKKGGKKPSSYIKTRMNLKCFLLSERNQSEKVTYV